MAGTVVLKLLRCPYLMDIGRTHHLQAWVISNKLSCAEEKFFRETISRVILQKRSTKVMVITPDKGTRNLVTSHSPQAPV